MTIKSDFGGAQSKATALKNATDSILQSASLTNDTQTTVNGNTNAQEAITAAQETAKQIAAAISLASANIQSVAEDFEALDQSISQTMRASIGGLNNIR